MAKRKYTRKNTKQTKTTTKKRKYKRRKNTKKSTSIKFIAILIILIAILSTITFYTIVIFPQSLQVKIETDLKNIYKPINLQQKEDFILFKLASRPTKKLQEMAFTTIKKNYGLSLQFTKIVSNSHKGINKIEFYRNKKQFSGIKHFYIFWDMENDKNSQSYNTTNRSNKDISRRNSIKKEFIKIEEEVKIPKNTTKRTISSKQFKQKITHRIEQDVNYAKIAIIIDDVGYNYNSTYDFLTLGFPITFAIIPDAIKSRQFYNLFTKYNYDVILHIPMEPIKGKKYVEKNAIVTDMTDNLIKKRINLFFNEYPLAIGANNHMGSKAVTDARVMKDLLETLSSRHKLWLDSMTSKYTVTKEIASLLSMHYLERDVFLDNNKDYNSISKAMDKLIDEARKKGYAIGIGHIQSSVLVTVLKKYYSRRNQLMIRFVSLKEIPKY